MLIGGWQTDRERAYVALTRARDRTDVYVSRDDLGEEGLDEGAIERLAERMAAESRPAGERHARAASRFRACVGKRDDADPNARID